MCVLLFSLSGVQISPLCAALYCHLWPLWLDHIFPHYLINGTIFGEMLLNIKCVFWFTPNYCLKKKIVLRRIQRNINHVQGSSCQVPLKMLDFSWFQTYAVFWMLYAFFWVIPRRLNFICRRFGTLCLFHLHRQVGTCLRRWKRVFRNVGNYPQESIKQLLDFNDT